MITALLAIIIANSPLRFIYENLITSIISIEINNFRIEKPILLWINDGAMAVFFLLIGLELKKEFLSGIFKDKKQITLPLLGALGGILFPVVIYYIFNYHDKTALDGWAIPAATDIAFAVGILALLGSSASRELKILLTSIAIFDDLAAVLIIAVFYTPSISISALLFVGFCIVILFVLNRIKVVSLLIYLVIGIIMWAAMIKSGVHATLTGFILAFFIPTGSSNHQIKPLDYLEKKLQMPVAFVILPLFAFVNSGIDFSSIGLHGIFHHVSIGVALGLFIGKQLGVFLFCYVTIKLKLSFLPRNTSWLQLYGISILTGVGFTMSLFIGSLAFEQSGNNMLFDERVGILMGSVLSAIFGYFVLKYSTKKAQ
ncbi:Na+/H+ antiporter NhaA [Thiotrichales bacterium 19S11-10]|nr:Na+/H+ antiporter NhaA [Thiotrichales bacterium 19S11-10]